MRDREKRCPEVCIVQSVFTYLAFHKWMDPIECASDHQLLSTYILLTSGLTEPATHKPLLPIDRLPSHSCMSPPLQSARARRALISFAHVAHVWGHREKHQKCMDLRLYPSGHAEVRHICICGVGGMPAYYGGTASGSRRRPRHAPPHVPAESHTSCHAPTLPKRVPQKGPSRHWHPGKVSGHSMHSTASRLAQFVLHMCEQA